MQAFPGGSADIEMGSLETFQTHFSAKTDVDLFKETGTRSLELASRLYCLPLSCKLKSWQPQFELKARDENIFYINSP